MKHRARVVKARRGALRTQCALLVLLGALGPGLPARAAKQSALSNEPVPLQVEKAPDRPRPLLELGGPFLGTGPITPGFEIPTGAVWQPRLLLWGSFRTAVQSFDPTGEGSRRISEWRNRWDIFAQVEVSSTERLVVGFRPLDDGGKFTGCGWEPANPPPNQKRVRDGCDEYWNGDLQTLFAEGNLGEIFPHVGADNSRALDIEFSVGRQPLLFQDGFLIADDKIDMAAVTRNNIAFAGSTNTRVATVFAWNDVDRADNREDSSAMLGGIFIETDVPASTLNFDTVVVASRASRGTSIHGGLSFVQRLGKLSTTFRGLYSHNFEGNTPEAATGGLFFGELLLVPPTTHDNLYLNAFFGVERFTSAVRSPDAGGPLGRTGILFGAVGLGNYGAPLGSGVKKSFGGALGYQMFFAENRRQLVLEIGARGRYENSGTRPGVGAGARFQQAIGRRVVARLDAFGAHLKSFDFGWGGRVEMLVKY